MLNDIRKYVLSALQFGAFPYHFISDSEAYKNSKVVIMGVPFDGTVTYQTGAKMGPNAILNASVNVEPYDDELGEIYTVGIFIVGTLKVQETIAVPKGKNVVALRAGDGIVKDNKF